MHFFERVWATVTVVTSWITLSPIDSSSGQQVPLLNTPDSVDIVKPPQLPIFKPPSGRPVGPGSDFKCDYSKMPGYVPCSTPEDRSCWLYNPTTKDRFDIHQDYETKTLIGVDRYYTLLVDGCSFNADGLLSTDAKLFNSSFPGPWIEACWGDTVHVKVINSLRFNGTSIHWHGIRQLDSMEMDGVNGVTQCPIAPGYEFTYKWKVTQYGSSWYHSHYSVQYADGLQGPITLHGPHSKPYDEAKVPLLMTDWGHNSAFKAIYTDLQRPSILLNGKGNITRFDNKTADLQIPKGYSLTFEKVPGKAKKYLLHLINTSFASAFVFSIDNHELEIVTSDFVPIKGYRTKSVLVAIGQRYDIIVEAKPTGDKIDPDGNFWIRTGVVLCNGDGYTGTEGYNRTGILRYDALSPKDPLSHAWADVQTTCAEDNWHQLEPVYPWTVSTASNGNGLGEDFKVQYNQTGTFIDGRFYGLLNFSMDPLSSQGLEAPFTPFRMNYSDPMFLHLSDKTDNWDPHWVVIPENYKATDWVYFVIVGGGHPIHLHGHDFAILQQTSNTHFTPDLLKNNKLYNPPRRDVVLLPPSGFVVIAFKTDNPGNWLMHCHIAFHASMGLALQILERQPAAAKMWPPNSPAIKAAEDLCDTWDVFFDDCRNWWPGWNDTTQSYPACEAVKPLVFQDDSGI